MVCFRALKNRLESTVQFSNQALTKAFFTTQGAIDE
jgi:hypothetical protein